MIEQGPTPGSVIGGKFRVLRALGSGGMGAVYEIEHVFTHHRRALKLLHPHVVEHPAVVERFLREASAAGRIGNPHIVETFDAGTLETGEPYLVMELLSGSELAQILAEHGRLAPGTLAHLVRQACSGVQAAHDAGVVHRDLKPENLFVTERDGQPFVKILDFGISKFESLQSSDHAVTREGSMLGTPYYMPPEQVRGAKDLDARADVYALGVILYEAASGKRPFEADSLPHLALLIHEGRAAPLAESCPDLPPEFCRVVERAMAAQREQRFQTARDLGDALAAFETRTDRGAYAATVRLEPSASAPPPAASVPPSGSAPAKTADLAPAMPIPLTGDGRTASVDAGALGRTVDRPPRGRLGLGLVAGAVAIVVIAGSFVALRGHGTPAAGSASQEPALALPQVSVDSAPAAAAPSPSVGASTIAGGGSAAPAIPGRRDAGVAVAPKPAVSAAPAASTKAARTGLAAENPY